VSWPVAFNMSKGAHSALVLVRIVFVSLVSKERRNLSRQGQLGLLIQTRRIKHQFNMKRNINGEIGVDMGDFLVVWCAWCPLPSRWSLDPARALRAAFAWTWMWIFSTKTFPSHRHCQSRIAKDLACCGIFEKFLNERNLTLAACCIIVRAP